MAESGSGGRPAVVVTLLAAVALAGAWLAAPPMGTDLSAQVARADFFAGYGWAPVDFRWYGGVSPHGYSLVSPPLMAWFGPRPVGAAAAVVSAVALAVLLVRTGARRPLLGGVLGAVCFTGNLVSGRVTFALGVALGLLAVAAVAGLPGSIMEFLRRHAGDTPRKLHDRRGARYALGGVLAVLAAAASPVAGLFVGLAGTALLLRGSRVAGLVLAAGAAVPIAVMAGLFGSGGWMNMSRADMTHATVTSLAVAALVPHRVVRTGALLSAAGVVTAYLVHTPVGLNATRLATLFALPLVAAYATLPRWPSRWHPAVWLVPVLALLAWWQPPVIDRDLTGAGDPTTSPAYFAPLREQLARRQPASRVEVVPTVNYWESAYLGGEVPLARGWLRQVDLGRNPLFFDGSLDAASYRDWLAHNGVSYVALAEARASWIGRREAELIRGGLPYLTPVWRGEHWTLYEVAGATSIVAGDAIPRAASPDAVTVQATAPGEILLRVSWSRWLAVDGPGTACLAPAEDEWTTLRVAEPGVYRVTGALTGAGPRC